MFEHIRSALTEELKALRQSGLYKQELLLESPQGVEIIVAGLKVINFSSNNYLGLANHPAIAAAARAALKKWGYGLSSVRFISGTQTIHKQLEAAISKYLSTDDTLLYSSCFDANSGLFEALTDDQDVIFSDTLNHASLIDGIRLSKAKRVVYEHLDMADLETKLGEWPAARRKIIVTDGVFSMDGEVANVASICALAEKYQALVMVDDSHATGVLGPTGRGTAEAQGVTNQVDIVTSTLSKSLGGTLGGFTSGRKEIIECLRQRSRPYIFSGSLTPVIVGGSLAVLELLSANNDLRIKLHENTNYARERLAALGLDLKPGNHPIIPVMLYDAATAQAMATRLLDLGVYVSGFFFPVVPVGQARIRVQISAAHSKAQIDRMVDSFRQVQQELGSTVPATH